MSAIPIVRPSHPALEDFEADFNASLESGVVTNDGPWVRMFEAALTEYLGIPTIAFCNGQSALMAMLAASDVRGGEVVLPSFTFCATPHAVEWAGATPRFADIDEKTLCMNEESCHARVGPRTKAILGVDPYGILWEPPLYQGGSIKALSDSAPSFGSRKLRKGSGSDAKIFSFHATKPFSTMEGGALCSHDLDLINRAKRIRNFGQDASGDCDEPGINGKMMEICAIIGLRQFDRWGDARDARVDHAEELAGALDGIPGLKVIDAPGGQSPIWLYRPVLIQKEFGMSRDSVVQALKRFDIHVRTYYRPCHQLSQYKHMNVSLPVTERIASQVIALPIFNDMKSSEIDRIASALKNLQSGGGY